MQIDWANFSPLSALAGGGLIGSSAGLAALFTGRIAGVSGMIAGLVPPRRGDLVWRSAFLVGLLATPLLVSFFYVPTYPHIELSYPLIGLAGILVGFGARLAGGCTSGHGVCGLSRLSLRSLAATVSFMVSAMATVFILRHVIH